MRLSGRFTNIQFAVMVLAFCGCTKEKQVSDTCFDPYSKSSHNETMWRMSESPGETEHVYAMMERAIHCGADVNAPDTVDGIPHGWPPVTLVAFGNAGNPTRQGNDSIWNTESIRMLQLLIDHGAKIDAVNSDGANALMLATIGARLPVVRFLLGKGLDVNAKSNLNTNALFGAVASGNVELVELLLSKGIEVNLVSKENRTVLDMAILIAEDAAQAQMRNANGADPAMVVELLKRRGAKTVAQLGVE